MKCPLKSTCHISLGAAFENLRRCVASATARSLRRSCRRRMLVTVAPDGTPSTPLRFSMSDIFFPPSVGWALRNARISKTTGSVVALGELLGRRHLSLSESPDTLRFRHLYAVFGDIPYSRQSARTVTLPSDQRSRNSSRTSSTDFSAFHDMDDYLSLGYERHHYRILSPCGRCQKCYPCPLSVCYLCPLSMCYLCPLSIHSPVPLVQSKTIQLYRDSCKHRWIDARAS